MKLRLEHGGEPVEVSVERKDDAWEVCWAGRTIRVESLDSGSPAGAFLLDGRPRRILFRREGRSLRIALGGEMHELTLADRVGGARAHGTRNPETRSPMPGKVLQIAVKPGDRVEAGDPLLILEAMKMENVLAAEIPGEVTDVHVAVGDMVEPGKLLVVVRPDE